ncbi:HAMP domain-containing sensor histidine kinase, partial [[Clostridium] symbiosum]
QEVVWMQMYRDHILLYDSQFPYMKANPEYHVTGQFYEWNGYEMIDFQDGEALVFLTGMYTYQFFNYALIVEFLLSFLLFTGIIMAGIRSTMKYIRTLSAEIGILEGGNLDYRITVTGSDEMAVLAKGLDSMRESIRDKISQEAELIRLNQSMITGLSHDLRTPLTALLIYTEILKNEIDADRKQMQKWVLKIDEKAHQIKDMADCILKYSLLNKAAGPTALRQEPFRSVFYDSLSELCVCLEQKGFEVRPSLAWEDREICADSKYITRILDNICSNIIKYASCGDPIRIESFYQTDGCGLVFENKKSANQTQAESTGIGVRNIREMMEEMGGCCEAEETSEDYRIRLTLACSPAV